MSTESVEEKFVEFFESCRKENFSDVEMLEICQPLLGHQQRRKKWPQLWFLVGFITLTVYLLYQTETFTWSLTAVGRLGLIQLLPFWDWTPLYNRKCLIDRERTTTSRSTISNSLKLETELENCLLCESIDHIDAISNVTYGILESNYLERGLPVIVTDSHHPKSLTEFLNLTQLPGTTDFLDSDPCDLRTNLMLRKYFNIESALQKIKLNQVPSKWFLQLRNCNYRAVKASRLFVTRPYYYPLQLEPFYTSWVLMSHNYALDAEKLYLRGLIFVQQLEARFLIQLQPKSPCGNKQKCPSIKLFLKAGECLVFSTDLWNFYYSSASSTESSNTNETAIATILEIDWHF